MLVLVRMYDYVWIIPELQIRNNILKAEKMSVGRWSDYRENVCWLRVHLRKDICWISHRSCCFEQGMYGLQCRTGLVETDGSCTLRIRVSDVCRKVGWYRGIISSLHIYALDVFLTFNNEVTIEKKYCLWLSFFQLNFEWLRYL